jgi:hypothetical protein
VDGFGGWATVTQVLFSTSARGMVNLKIAYSF